MQIHISDLINSKLGELSRPVPARPVPSRPVPFRFVPSDDGCTDVDIASVQSVVVTPETITFIFENNYTFVANVPSDC